MENPLLPHRKLKELYKLMLRCRELDRKPRQPLTREALLAAITIHLLPGDILCADPGDTTLAAVAPANRSGIANAGLVAPPKLPFAAKLATASAIARGQLAASPADALALTAAFCTANTPEPGWQHALSVAQHTPLPLVLVVADTGTASRSKTALTWPNLSRFAKRLRLPILSVDGEDAVAVFRCMQESTIRARFGAGPAVIWAVMSPQPQPRSRQPLARLQRYLADRKISLPR